MLIENRRISLDYMTDLIWDQKYKDGKKQGQVRIPQKGLEASQPSRSADLPALMLSLFDEAEG